MINAEAIAAAIGIIAAAELLYILLANRRKHLFLAWNPATQTYDPKRRNPTKTKFLYRGPDGKVMFPLAGARSMNWGKKGTIFIGDVHTGKILDHGESEWSWPDGKALAHAQADTREVKLAKAQVDAGASKPMPWLLLAGGAVVAFILFNGGF